MTAGADWPAWWPYVVILVAGWLATDAWRYLGVIAAGRLTETSPVFIWVKAVATALLAGLIARLMLFPEGGLAASPLWLRLGAMAIGFAVFRMARNSVLLGILAAEAVLIGGVLLLS